MTSELLDIKWGNKQIMEANKHKLKEIHITSRLGRANDGVGTKWIFLPKVVSGNDDWRAEAECRGLPTDYFFPNKGRMPAGQMEWVMSVCRSCSVRWECFVDAIETEVGGNEHGIRGGIMPRTRMAMRRQMNIELEPSLKSERSQ